MIRDDAARGSLPASSFTEYLPGGTIDKSSTIDLAERTPAAPFSCHLMFKGIGLGVMRSAWKARLNRPSSTRVIVSEMGREESAGAFPYSSQNRPIFVLC